MFHLSVTLEVTRNSSNDTGSEKKALLAKKRKLVAEFPRVVRSWQGSLYPIQKPRNSLSLVEWLVNTRNKESS